MEQRDHHSKTQHNKVGQQDEKDVDAGQYEGGVEAEKGKSAAGAEETARSKESRPSGSAMSLSTFVRRFWRRLSTLIAILVASLKNHGVKGRSRSYRWRLR